MMAVIDSSSARNSALSAASAPVSTARASTGCAAAACDRCGSHAAVTLFANFDNISGESFAVQRCVQCGWVRTDFPYEAAALGRYYGTVYFGDEGRRFVPVMEWFIDRFRRARVNLLLRYYGATTPGTVLDVGCGRGLMLANFKQRGWTALGTELSGELAAKLQAEHGIPVYTEPQLADNRIAAASIDILVHWHSLEHQVAPYQTLQESVRLLKPGGIMVIEVPNLASVQAQIGQRVWFHLDTPRHQYHFSAATLRSACQDLGLQVLDATTLSFEQGLYGMIQTLLNRITTIPNVLYYLFRKKRPLGRRLVVMVNILLTLGLLPLIGPLGIILEGLAVLRQRGGVIRLVVQKPADVEAS